MLKFNKLKDKKGFTLVELLVVIAVLGIIAGIAIPKMSGVSTLFRKKTDVETAKRLVKQVQVMIEGGHLEIPNNEDFVDDKEFAGGLSEKYWKLYRPVTVDGYFWISVGGKDDSGNDIIKVYVLRASTDNVNPDASGNIINGKPSEERLIYFEKVLGEIK